jgi:hypothetical protein
MYLSEAVYPPMLGLAGTSADAYCWVKTSTASQARIALYHSDGTTATTTYSSYHTGGGNWEQLSVTSESIIADAISVKAMCVIAGAGDTYFDDFYLKSSKNTEFYAPTSFKQIIGVYEILNDDVDELSFKDESKIEWDWYRDGSDRLLIQLKESSSKRLRLYGEQVLTVFTGTSETGTTEITDSESRYLVAAATRELLEKVITQTAAQDVDKVAKLLNYWNTKSRELSRLYGRYKPAGTINFPRVSK